MLRRIARWDRARDVWARRTTGLSCGHSGVFSETWPTSGMTRGGTAFELPTWEHRTVDSGSSSSLTTAAREPRGSVLPTPRCADGMHANLRPGTTDTSRLEDAVAVNLLGTPTARMWKGSGPPGSASHDWLLDHGNLEAQVLLPSPRASDGTKGGPNQRGSSGDLMLPSAVTHLLPTPAVNDMGEGKTVEGWDAWTAETKARLHNGNGHGKSLAIEAQKLLPTPSVADGTGGHRSRSGSRSDELLLPGVVKDLLPTPESSDASGGRVNTEMGGTRPSGAKRAVTLATAVSHKVRLLPTPSATEDQGTLATHPRADANFETNHAVALCQVVHHQWTGDSTDPPSLDGSTSSTGPRPRPPSPPPEERNA